MIPTMIAQFAGTLLGKVAVGGGMFAILLTMYGCEVSRQRSIGVQKERARVEKQGEKTDAKATTARRAAERRAPDGLREYTRD